MLRQTALTPKTNCNTMVKLRLAKQGRKKLPIYKIVAADSRARRDGRFIESLGQYRPSNDTNKLLDVKEERIMYWLKVGAQPTSTVRSLLSKEGILLKWHLEKKQVDAARAEEIFNTWKAHRDSAVERKVVARQESIKRKKAEAAKAAEAAAKAKEAAEAPVAEAPAAEVAEAPAVEAPVAEAPVAEAPAAEAAPAE